MLIPTSFSPLFSHIEWYLARGVDITVIVSTRDSTISRKGKLSGHCQVVKTAEEENKVAKELLEDAIQKYGKHGSKLGNSAKERVISVSYEALIGMQDSYLLGLYKQLGINSTYIPKFVDGNVKYVTDATDANLDEKIRKEQQEQQSKALSLRPPKPSHPQVRKNEFFLPRRLITVFSLDPSRLLSTSLAVAVGAFPSGGRWVEQDGGVVFEDAVKRSVRSLDGETEIQHIMLPTSVIECDGEKVPILDALAPSECSLPSYKEISPESSVAEQCKDEVFISQQNGSTGASWTCGGICGAGEYNGYALYPERYFVNISSHIEWYTTRGVDVTAVLQLRDRSITKKSLFNRIEGRCRSRMILAKEDDIGLSLMKEAYQKYGVGGTIIKTQRHRNVAERAIVVSYESLIEFKETYLFGIYQQLGIRSSHAPIFIDENAQYVRTPPPKKKAAGGQPQLSSRVALERKPNERIHLKSSEESIR